MKEKIKLNSSQKSALSSRNPSLKLSHCRTSSSLANSQQILFNHKSSLEILLNMIKTFQMDYFSKNKNKMTKQMLITLKENLGQMLTEKNKKYNYIKNLNESSKKKVQNILFYSPQDKPNKDEINKLSLQTCSLVYEKNQLELLNFQIKDEIEKIDFLHEQKEQSYSYIRSIPFFFEENRDVFCNNNYESLTKISGILKEIIREVRKEFIEVVKEKMKKELEINGISYQINYIKDSIEDYKLKGCKKYIETKDIIDEESKEFSKSFITNQSKRNSLSSINKNMLINKSFINKNSKNKYKSLKKERKIKDTLQNNNNIFFTNKNKRDIFSDINNKQINNYLNMNINVNINLNNNKNNCAQESFNSSLDSSNNENEQYEMDLENNKIIITPITTNENINELTSKNDSINTENNEESYILDINENK